MIRRAFFVAAALAWCGVVRAAEPLPGGGRIAVPATAAPATLVPRAVLHRAVTRFNAMEDESVVNDIPNAQAESWLAANIPRFACPDPAVEEIYYFRWWALRKHLRTVADGSTIFTEFISRADPVSSALGHHLREGRWLRDPRYHDAYVRWWLFGADGKPQPRLHQYSQWLAAAVWDRYLVTGDRAELVTLLDALVADYRQWEQERQLPNGLFWQYDVRDAMEESISGSRRQKNIRPTLNSYMFGNARALAAIAGRAGRPELAREFSAKAAQLRRLTQESLWHPEQHFFEVRLESGPLANVREEIGFIPWYFELPEPNRGFERAWAQLTDDAGFRAPFGITTAERRHPQFRSHGVGKCEWDGAVWPFATSQTLTALANVLHDYPPSGVTRADYFAAFLTYVRSHRMGDKPYIGEYLDERTGAWLKGDHPRSRWYNHSTFADLLISGVVGLRPAEDGFAVDPLLPPGTWAWFALEDVRWHGHDVAIRWDADGSHFRRGAGLVVELDGQPVASAPRLERVVVQFRDAR